MCQVGLNLNLTPHLPLNLPLLYLGLVQHLQGADEASALFLGQIHSTKLSFPQWFSNLEHAKVEFSVTGRLHLQWIRQSLGGYDAVV